jgi:beta-lactamase class A
MKIIERNFLNLITCVIAVSFFTVSCTAGKSFCQSPKNTSAVIQSKPLYSKQDQGKGVFRQSESKLTNKTDYDRPLRRLQCEVRRLAALAGGTVGLSALHIESGQHFSFNGGERFPMASVYKIPIAVQLLSRVDRGKVSLNQTVTLSSCDFHPGSGKLIQGFKKKKVSYTVRELLELMLLISDNTASDALLKLAGGPEAVTSFMKNLGISDIEVSRSTLNMLADWRGIKDLPAPEVFTLNKYNRLRDNVPAEALDEAQNCFFSDIRDTATPEAMTRLIAKIYNGTALKPESASILLEIMERCQTGKTRIRRLIPPGMAVADKTGTIGKGMVNDTAVMPHSVEAGHVALTIFIKTSEQNVSQQEQVMAQIARYLYDYFFFYGQTSSEAACDDSCRQNGQSCYQ